MARVIIVGGGISGLATAWFLRRRGVDVVVLEANAAPGGAIRTIVRDGFLVEAGPNSTLMRGGAFQTLVSEIGLSSELIVADRRASRYVVYGSTPVALPRGPLDFVTTRLFSASAKLRVMGEPFRGRTSGEESIAQFVRRRLGPEFLEKVVDPFVSGIYAGDAERLSIRAAMPRLYALEAEHGSLVRGMVATIFRKRKSARTVSFRRGMQSLPLTLAQSLGDSVRFNANVVAITREGNEWCVRTNDNEYRASGLVLALPAYAAASLLESLSPEASRHLHGIDYAPVASVALGFRREQVQHALDGFGALFPRNAQRRTLGVIFSSTLFPNRAPAGHVLLTAFVGGARHREVVSSSAPELLEIAYADIASVLGISGAPVFTHVSSWPRAIPQYELGHLSRLKAIEVALYSLPNLYLRANWRDGVSLADSVANAAICAEQI